MRNDIIEKFNNLDGIVHSAAFALREQLNGKYLDNITKDGFLLLMMLASTLLQR